MTIITITKAGNLMTIITITKDNKSNNGWHNTAQKTNDWATRIPLNPGTGAPAA
jgi:hypothetical protein